MKLKPIPANTVVHTPTEAEAKELLAILHENGYKWSSSLKYNLLDIDYWTTDDMCYIIKPQTKVVGWNTRFSLTVHSLEKPTFHTLTDFKRLYCEEEKPQPKLRLGTRIRIVSSGEEDFINMITEDDCYELLEHRGKYTESDLEPYTEPETKDEAKDEAKDETKDETKELNLCELLKGHEGEEFFSLAYGGVVLKEIRRGTQRGDSPDFLCVRTASFDSGTIFVNPNGKLRNAGVVDLVPSRALYEQYPLDAYTAWMKWQEEQKKYSLIVDVSKCDNEKFIGGTKFPTLTFRTPADRDKCIEKIKAIIEKYSKK